jgi:nitroreductase
MDLATIIEQRFSPRAFHDRPLPEKTLQRIFAMAQRTPSWCNTQPWQVVVTATREATERLRDALAAHLQEGHPPAPDFPFPERYQGIYRERRKFCASQLYGALGIAREDSAGTMAQSMKNFAFFDAPHAGFVFVPQELGFYGGVDCGLYAYALCLAATDQGAGCIAQAALAVYPDFIRSHFSIPSEMKLVYGFSMGFVDESHPANSFRTQRAALEESVRFITS